MPKEWILNQANMRWGLTKKKKVGAVSDEIRRCAPKSLREWQEYYFSNVYPKEHLENLGRTLYIKISEVCQAEIESITEHDSIDFIENLVINRTYDGYQSEIQTIYGQLQQILGIKIEPAPEINEIIWSKDGTGGRWGSANKQRPIFGSYPYPPNFLFKNVHEHILIFAKPPGEKVTGKTVVSYNFLTGHGEIHQEQNKHKVEST